MIRLNSNMSSYHYCKAFLVSQLCIDENVKELPDHEECLIDGDGNEPSEFKRSIYRDECRQYYVYFFESQISDSTVGHNSNVQLILGSFLVYYVAELLNRK